MRDPRHHQRGMTLMETTAAIALVGLAILVAASLLAAHPRAAERVAAHQEMLRVLEATLESLRAGVLPLEDGRVRAPIPVSRPLTLSLEVRATEVAGLWEIIATARTEVRGQTVSRSQHTLLWRPS